MFKNLSNYVQDWEEDAGYDIIAADLTISKEREKTMDFSVPFMKLGNTILMRRPKELSYMFSFLYPFSFSTWLLLIGSYALTSSLLFITSRLDCPSPSLPACIWLPLASLLGQSTDYLPTSASPRLLITAWWLFVLLLVSAYTANMAAFLTVSRCRLNPPSALPFSPQTSAANFFCGRPCRQQAGINSQSLDRCDSPSEALGQKSFGPVNSFLIHWTRLTPMRVQRYQPIK